MAELEDRLNEELQPELEILRALGRGAHAEVFLAREPSLKRLVALKVLRPELANDAVIRQRFEREAQSAASITHTNVTPIYYVRRLSDDLPYIVMEYIDGRTLEDTIGASGPLPVDQARTLLANIASALGAAHARGIVHRDVRPGNVFVEKGSGRAVLADFGIAALVDTGSEKSARLTAAGHRVGDMNYMSPEQLRGEPVTEQSDIYAFGILAYEVLTGRGPYEARNATQIVAAHLQQEPRPLTDLRPGIDAGLAAIIQRCLNKDANRRPSASVLAAQLVAPAAAPQAAAPPEPEPTGPFAGFLRELKRRRVYQVAGGYLIVGYGMVQVVNEFGEALPFPDWASTVVAVMVVAGFPVALVLSWIYDITSRGIRRTDGDPEDGSRAKLGVLPWIALAASFLLAALLGWLLLPR